MDDAELPRALIKRIAKASLSQQSNADGRDIQLSKDALLALSESARVFINYLTATGRPTALSIHSAIPPDEVLVMPSK
jgi:histone H3/H4